MSWEVLGRNLTIGFRSSLRSFPEEVGLESKMKCCLMPLEKFLSDKKGLNLASTFNEGYSFHLTLCGDQRMKGLNKEFRGKSKTTDVLSFPMFDSLREPDDFFGGFCELGDIFISYPVCQKQAKEFSLTFEEEFFHLLVHGFLHLCGYDHEVSMSEEKLMEEKEAILVKNILKKIKDL